MPEDKLSPLQWRVLRALATIAPPWTLTGGAALAGVYLGHRATRDLDLFWHDTERLERLPEAVAGRLRSDGPRTCPPGPVGSLSVISSRRQARPHYS